MKSPIEIRHDHFRQLYFSERAKREMVRSSIGPPVSAIAFSVFAYSALATEFDFSRWQEPVSIAILVLACLSILALFAAMYFVVMIEWLFVYHEPPGLENLLAAEERFREERPDTAAERLTELLTASYFIAYQQYLCGNINSARDRTWALRLVLLSLFFLSLCFILLPIHLAGG